MCERSQPEQPRGIDECRGPGHPADVWSRTLYSVMFLAACDGAATLSEVPPTAIDGGFVDDASVLGLPDAALADAALPVHLDAAVDAGFAPDADPIFPDAAVADAGEADSGPTLGELCFADIFDPNSPGPDYDQFSPTYGRHCLGTNHQNIHAIERVVFIGDSVTVGTPPTPSEEYYRALLADRLAARFSLQAPSDAWKRASLVNGTSLIQNSGDFWSCAKWGARADDLIQDNSQIEDCFPESERHKKTLVIMTIGGNDIAAITKAGAPSGNRSLAEVTQMTQEFVGLMADAARWLKDPANVPGGVDLIYANMFEFTDATGDVTSCPAANLAGFDEPWANPQDLEDLVVWANEEFMRAAVETGADMIFLLENFCGHGYRNEDPAGRCYRGPGAERWFDLSCIHPNPIGHAVIADMFMAVVDE